jgi:hypothetical protein
LRTEIVSFRSLKDSNSGCQYTCGYCHQGIIQGVFSLPGQDFVREILSNVFYKSDFETKIVTARLKFILHCSIMVRLCRSI